MRRIPETVVQACHHELERLRAARATVVGKIAELDAFLKDQIAEAQRKQDAETVKAETR